MHFRDEKVFFILRKGSLKFVPKGPIDNNPAFSIDNGLASNIRQVIIWTNADPIHWCINAALGGNELTHCGLDKMIDILQTFSFMKNVRSHLILFIIMSLKSVPKDLTDNKTALVLVMARHWTGNKPLPVDSELWWHMVPLGHNELTHWGRDKMADIFQTTYSKAFSWMKKVWFRLKFHWGLFLWVRLTISQHWFR